MPNNSSTLRTNAGFFHSLGKVLTESTNSPGAEKYKSAHNVRSNEVWMDPIPFAIDFASASQYSDNIVVTQHGTPSNPLYLYPLTQTNYQTWFLDIGTPTPQPDGFEPSTGWVKPLINPSDVQREDGFPSLGYGLSMYRPNGSASVAYGNAFFEVDYFAGLLRWEIGKTPADLPTSNGMGFQFDSSTFAALGTPSKQAYIQSPTTGGPRAIAFQYTGQRLSNYTIGSGTGFTAGPGLTLSSGATLSVLVDNTTIGFNVNNELTVLGASASSWKLSVADYNTGTTYSNIENIIFRGGVINVPVGVTAGAVLVTPNDPVTVTVWIPKPDYVGYFTPSLSVSTTNRYIATPTSNTYSSAPGNTGSYATGTWIPSTDFTGSTTRPSIGNAVSSVTAFSEAEFACFDLNTTLQFELFDSDGSEIRGLTISLTTAGTYNSSPTGISITVNSFAPNNDRYKANVTGTINISSIFPNGGKFTGWRVTHYNSGDGPGAGSPLVTGVYKYETTSGYFWDNDLSPSSANLSGTVVFDELTPTLVYYSGVAFYDTGSTFALTASGVNLLNDITFPSTKQIDFSTTNMSTTGTLDGHSNGTKAAGTAITGWNLNWDKSGLTYSKTSTVNATGAWIPGFSTNNTISSSGISRVTSTLYDWATVGSYNSGFKAMLFDTYSSSSKTYNNDPLESENGRLLTGSVLSNGSTPFVSTTVPLPSDELQYIFGRVIYPQTNFQNFFPLINQTNSVDYSSLSGSNKTFNIYTAIGDATGTTTPLPFNGYRWHVTSYTALNPLDDISTGRFRFNPSNFLESYLDRNTQISATGSQDLVILAGVDSTGSNSKPDKFLFLSGNAGVYPGRAKSNLYYLGSGASDPYSIAYNRQSLTFTFRKVWLFVGIADGSTIGTAASKNLYMSEITFITPS